MQTKPTIKILATYHENHKILKTDILESIQTGCANAESHFEGMLHDDTGDNISSLNDNYCELTAQYWAWKNYDSLGNPDYIGFMHDRRHFLFNDGIELMDEKWVGQYHYHPFITDDYIRNNFNPELIERVIEGNDIIVPSVFNYGNYYIAGKIVNKRKNYSLQKGQYVENYDLLMTITRNMYPEYSSDIDNFKKTELEYLCNIYIMRRNLFFEYAELLFSILERIRSLVDDTWFTQNGKRYLAYLAEFLCNIFIIHKLRTKKIKIEELPMVVMKHREEPSTVSPCFKENFCALAVPCSDAYAPYLSVWLQSLIDTSSKNHNYDVIVMERDISDQNKIKLASMLTTHDNISLRFINPSLHIDVSKISVVKSCLSNVSSYRIAVNKFMKGYSKVIITDIDLIMKRDIKELYDTDIGSAPIAAEIDPFRIMNYSRAPRLSDFVSNELGMSDKYRYVNTGVMILNIDIFNKGGYTEQLLDILEKKNCTCLEQDAMNGLFDDSIYLLDGRWNALYCDEKREKLLQDMPKKLYDEWKRCANDPWIMHWCGVFKPWVRPDEFMAYAWWEIARRTPYYEEIVARLRENGIREFATQKDQQLRKEFTQIHFPSINRRFESLFLMPYYSRIRFHMIRCYLLKCICFGRKRRHYSDRYAKFKNFYVNLQDRKRKYREMIG